MVIDQYFQQNFQSIEASWGLRDAQSMLQELETEKQTKYHV